VVFFVPNENGKVQGLLVAWDMSSACLVGACWIPIYY